MQLAALVRSAFKRPGYWLSFTATLAVIAGGAVAVFALFEAYLLRPAGFPDEDRVDFMTMSMSRPGLTETAYSLPTYRDLREKLSGYEALTIVTRLRTVLTGKQRGEQISALEAVPSFFDVFRVKPVIGRIFRPDEDERSGVRRVILFYPLWQHRYGGDPSIIGKTIEMDGVGWEVIGVLPPEYRFRSTEVLAIRTLQASPLMLSDRSWWAFLMCGLRRPGVARGPARAELEARLRQLEKSYPADYEGAHPIVFDMAHFYYPGFRKSLNVLLASAFLVLAVGCLNLAGLSLARVQAHHREMSVRLALGASPGQVALGVLVENALMGLLALGPALLLAALAARLFAGMLPGEALPVAFQPEVFVGVQQVVFAVAAMAVCVTAISAAPLLSIRGVNLGMALRAGTQGGGAGTDVRGRWMGTALIAVEALLAVVIASGAAVILKGVRDLGAVALGFNADRLLAVEISPPFRRSPAADPRNVAFWDAVRAGTAALPGVAAVATVDEVPVGNMRSSWSDFVIAGKALPPPDQRPQGMIVITSPGYPKAMEVPLVAGRWFDDSDTADRPHRTVISQTGARAWFPGENPVGRKVAIEVFCVDLTKHCTETQEIIGVAADIRNQRLDQPPSTVLYLNYRQNPDSRGYLLLRVTSGGSIGSFLPAVRDVVGRVQPDAAVASAVWIGDWVRGLAWKPRLASAIAALFGILALVLVAVGVNGVVANVTARLRRDFAVRLALGASPAAVSRLILVSNLAPGLVGAATGIVAAYFLWNWATGFIFDSLKPAVWVYAGAAAVIVLLILLAAAPHAFRAARIDPVEALRE